MSIPETSPETLLPFLEMTLFFVNLLNNWLIVSMVFHFRTKTQKWIGAYCHLQVPPEILKYPFL